MLLSEAMGRSSSCGIHTDIRHEGIPIHASNEGGALTFSTGRGYNRGLKGEDDLLEPGSEVWLGITAMNMHVDFKICITDACKKALDLTLSIATLSRRRMAMLLPRMPLHGMGILDRIAAVRISRTCEPIDRGGDELNRGTTRRG